MQCCLFSEDEEVMFILSTHIPSTCAGFLQKTRYVNSKMPYHLKKGNILRKHAVFVVKMPNYFTKQGLFRICYAS